TLNVEGASVRVYFKGLVSEETMRGEKVLLAGIGVAVCDLTNNLIFEVSKSVVGNGTSKITVELKALIQASNAVIALDLTRVSYYGDYYPLFQFLSGKWPAKQPKIAMLQVDECQHRYCFSCMKQHVEVKLLHGMVPKCPHEGCKNELLIDSCRKFLTSKLIETMQQQNR
ncbi:E3 ubiquitin-protein ligase RSL1-like, partial [Lathyrus oleraceus]|uniref:E3 ubiquitin-protein ligase RSL1-like n=1 Tax=Pisum sativum TaxID=3888 RepID=UPI0021D0DC55